MPNSAPIAVADSYSVPQDQQLSVLAPGVLANDSDPDGDTLTAAIVSGASNGQANLDPSGAFTYQPNAGFVGTDSFSYQAFDGTTFSGVATVTITVTSQTNQAPIAADDGPYSVLHDQTLTKAAPGVLANDSDPDGDTLTAILDTQPYHGSVNLNPDGSFSYTPVEGFTGTDSFTYHASDGTLASNPVQVNINVFDQPPTGQDQYYAAFSGSRLSIPVDTGLLYGATDPDGDRMTVPAQNVTQPGHGTLNLDPNENGAFSYTPNGNFQGTVSFTFQIYDSAMLSPQYTVRILVQAPPAQGVHVWTGQQNYYWNNAGNWQNGMPAAGDDVQISLTAENSFYPDTISENAGHPALDVTVRSITVLTTNRNNRVGGDVRSKDTDLYGSLTITGAGGVSDWRYKDIHFANDTATLTIQNDFTWHSGSIVGNRTVYVYDSDTSAAKLTITDDASTLAGPSLIVGIASTPGEVDLVNMNQNLTVANNADIWVRPAGKLYFLQDLGANQSGTKGGIVQAQPLGSPNSEIVNNGTVFRAANSDGNASYVDVNIPVTNYGGSLLDLDTEGTIRFNAPNSTYDVQQNDGTIDLAPGSQLIVPNGGLEIGGGSVLLRSDVFLSPATITITGIINLDGGTMTFGTLAGQYVNLVTTTFNFNDGTIYMRVDGTTGFNPNDPNHPDPHSDRITATTIDINDDIPTLDVTVVGQLAQGLFWDLLVANFTNQGGLNVDFHGANLGFRQTNNNNKFQWEVFS